MPPKAPGNAYVIFFTKYIKGLRETHQPKSLDDIQSISKDCSSMWKNFTLAEKQVRSYFPMAVAQVILTGHSILALCG